MNESNEVIIPRHTIENIIDDLTRANGPGVYFILVGVAEGKRPALMSTMHPDSMDEVFAWLVENKKAREVEAISLGDESTKKEH